MIIRHGTILQFYTSIEALTVRGLTFDANADTLVIYMTGGY